MIEIVDLPLPINQSHDVSAVKNAFLSYPWEDHWPCGRIRAEKVRCYGHSRTPPSNTEVSGAVIFDNLNLISLRPEMLNAIR